jgi:hypothetical protein
MYFFKRVFAYYTLNFNIFQAAEGCRSGDNLLYPATLYLFGIFTGMSPSSAANVLQNIQIVLLLLYSKQNMQGIITLQLLISFTGNIYLCT